MAKKRRLRTKRIYYGPNGGPPFWTIQVSDAKEDVVIDGKALHALRGKPGTDIGCAISNMGVDLDNKVNFPHPVFLIAVHKTRLTVIDKLDRHRTPIHGVVYRHSYGHIADKNDDRVLKKMVKEQPEIMERPFTLRAPLKRKKWRSGDRRVSPETNPNPTTKPVNAAFVSKGALRRARRAGLVSAGVARQLTDAVNGR